jgi:putative ABC transport system permease protein
MRSEIFGMLYFALKLSPTTHAHEVIEQLNQNWTRLFPADPFTYSFLDDHVNDQYAADRQFSVIFSVFSGFSIFISCLGLFGLVSYSVAVRVKEIGIRKVLGASVSSIVVLFSRSYAKLLLLSYLVGIPLSYYILTQWLSNFAYRASLSWWLFLIPVVLVSCLALITISTQTIKAALANPVESLSQE